MYSERYPIRERRITTSLRRALLICALAAAAIPIIVFYTTSELLRRQEDLSDRLLQTASRSAELNAALIELADDTEALGRLGAVPDLRAAQSDIQAGLFSLREAFTQDFSASPALGDTKQVAELLSDYMFVVGSVADSRVTQLDDLSNFEADRTGVYGALREANAKLLSTISQVSAEFERNMPGDGQSDAPTVERALLQGFRDLTLLRELKRLLDDIERRIVGIDPATSLQSPAGLAAQLRFSTRGLATRISKIRDAELKQEIARDILGLDRALLGAGGLIADYSALRSKIQSADQTAGEQTAIAAQLLGQSSAFLAASRTEALQGSNDIAKMVQDNRLAVLGLSIVLLLILFGLLFHSVGRVFAKRIRKLTDGVLAIANGDVDRKVDIGGDDELTAMGDALQIFRENRRNLVSSNDALQARNLENRELSTRLQTILDTTTSGIIAFNQEGGIILANPPARSFLGGISQETPFAWPDDVRFLDSEDLSPLEASKSPVRRALAGQKLHNELCLIDHPEKETERYMRISSAVVSDGSSPIRCVVVLEDVSEAEKNRQRVERSGRLDALGQLTGGIAHDFNNLLATIEYALELSVTSGMSAQSQTYLTTALGSVRRGSELTSRLLSFAKRQPGLASSQQVAEVMEEFRLLVEPSIEEALTLTFEEIDPGLYVHCDPGQLENALLNLVINARDAIMRSGKGNRITISVRAFREAQSDVETIRSQSKDAVHRSLTADLEDEAGQGGSRNFIEFSVTDNGPGMTNEVKRRALDPFFTTKDTNSGTGLGLSMVYGFIQNSDGELRIYSEEGHGTTVSLMLPTGTQLNQPESRVEDIEIPEGAGETVLIVEDDDVLRQIMADLVVSFGYDVVLASSGKDAIEQLDSTIQCDVVLTDIVMPGGIGGFELGVKLRELRPKIPLVYMSGYAGFTPEEMGGARGELVQKPCAPSELSAAIRTALETEV